LRYTRIYRYVFNLFIDILLVNEADPFHMYG